MITEWRTGAVGWDHPDWDDQFYPDDLPPDWRLTYYGNEFSQVLIPQRQWASASGAWEGWRDDVDAGFRFVLELDGYDRKTLEAVSACAQVLSGRLAGVVSWQPITQSQCQSLRRVLGASQFVATPKGSSGHKVDEMVALDDGVICLRVSDQRAADLRWLKECMRRLDDMRGRRDGWLFIVGEPPRIKVLREAVILQQLLVGVDSGRA